MRNILFWIFAQDSICRVPTNARNPPFRPQYTQAVRINNFPCICKAFLPTPVSCMAWNTNGLHRTMEWLGSEWKTRILSGNYLKHDSIEQLAENARTGKLSANTYIVT